MSIEFFEVKLEDLLFSAISLNQNTIIVPPIMWVGNAVMISSEELVLTASQSKTYFVSLFLGSGEAEEIDESQLLKISSFNTVQTMPFTMASGMKEVNVIGRPFGATNTARVIDFEGVNSIIIVPPPQPTKQTLSLHKLNILLGAIQSNLGEKVEPLTAEHLKPVQNEFELHHNQDTIETELHQGIFNNIFNSKGKTTVESTISIPLVLEYCADFLQCSGMKKETAGDITTFTPSSDPAADWKQMTLWSYSGDTVPGSSLLTKSTSTMFRFRIDLEIGEICTVTFYGKGAPDGYPSATNYITGSFPVVVATPISMLRATSTTIGGRNVSIVKMSIEMQNELIPVIDGSQSSGVQQYLIGARKTVWNASFYAIAQDSSAVHQVCNDISLLPVDLSFGVSGAKVKVLSPAGGSQIKNVQSAEDDGIAMIDVEGIFVNNIWSLTFDKGL